MSELLAPERPATEKSNQNDIIDWSVLTEVSEDVINANEQKEPFARIKGDTTETPTLEPILDLDQPSTKLEIPEFSDQETVDYITEKVSREREIAGPNEEKTKEMLTDVIDVLQDMRTALSDPKNELGGTDLIEHLIDEYAKGSEYYSDTGEQKLANQSARRLIAATDLVEKYDGLKAQYELRHAQKVAVDGNYEEQPPAQSPEKPEPEDDPFADGYIA